MDNEKKKQTYNVEVVVTITLDAETQNDACAKAQNIVAKCVEGKTQNNYYPDWIGVRKAKYSY